MSQPLAKKDIVPVFAERLEDFVKEMIEVIPSNPDIRSFRKAIKASRMMQPRVLVEVWHKHVTEPYAHKIFQGDFNYFLDKDYRDDIQTGMKTTGNDTNVEEVEASTNSIIQSIQSLRAQIRDLDEQNLECTMQHIQNLCQLSNIYHCGCCIQTN